MTNKIYTIADAVKIIREKYTRMDLIDALTERELLAKANRLTAKANRLGFDIRNVAEILDI